MKTTIATLADVVDVLWDGDVPFHFRGFDGSSTGDPASPFDVALVRPRGLTEIATAPSALGLARAYVLGDLVVHGIHPGDPYPFLAHMIDRMDLRKPNLSQLAAIVSRFGSAIRLPTIPSVEGEPRWRRTLGATKHSKARDSRAIRRHYDVSNAFYRMVLGESMTYTCAYFSSPTDTLESAQDDKHDLIARKLALRPGDRLLDVGCGWGSMVRRAATRYGANALGVTLSRQQAQWGAAAVEADGLTDHARVLELDYRDVVERDFDAICSIGLTEHIGVANYRAYFQRLYDALRPGGRLLNHCITRPVNTGRTAAKAFIDRYVFPDGELTGSGRIIAIMQDVGFDVRHEENLREHYALTLAAWCANLVNHWDECVREAGRQIAMVWGLYLAESRLGFERNMIQLHQVLAAKPTPDGRSGFPLRADWNL